MYHKMIFIKWFLLVVAIPAYADQASLLGKIKSDALLQSGVHIVEEEERAYLVGVDRAPIGGQTPQAKITALKIAKIKAQRAIALFVHGSRLSTEEKLTKTTTTERNYINGKQISVSKKRIKLYEHTISEKANGILVNIQILGRWIDGGNYYFAYYYPL